jgi:hypothetical protein
MAGAMGKYQFIPARLQALGYGNVDQQSFLSNPALQEEVMDKHLLTVEEELRGKGLLNDQTDMSHKAGLIWAAHLGGIGGAMAAAEGKEGAKDALGTSVQKYYLKGKQAFLNSMGIKATADFRTSSPFAANGEMNKAYDAARLDKPRPGAMELFATSFEAADAGTQSGLFGQLEKSNTEVNDKISKAIGKDFGAILDEKYKEVRYSGIGGILTRFNDVSEVVNPFSWGAGKDVSQWSDTAKAFDQAIAQVRQEHPNVKLPVESFADVKKMAGEVLDAKEQAQAKLSAESTWLPWLAGVAGSMVGFMNDRQNLASMAVTAPIAPAMAGVAGVATRAAANAGVELVAIQPGVQSARSELVK